MLNNKINSLLVSLKVIKCIKLLRSSIRSLYFANKNESVYIKAKFPTFKAAVLALLLAGCGGSSTPTTPAVYTGELLDGPISGVSYSTATQSGTTNDKGEFSYQLGETVTFGIGGIDLGGHKMPKTKPTVNPKVTPVELLQADEAGDTNVVRMLQLLQSLDEDDNHDNGIKISASTLAAAASLSYDFADKDFATKNPNFDLHNLVKTARGKQDAKLVNPADALENFIKTIKAQNLPIKIGGSYQLVWADEFEGTSLDASNWNYETGYGSNGWGNDEWQNYTNNQENIAIVAGTGEDATNSYLKISALCPSGTCGKRDGTITSAKINTKGKLDFAYGKVEARIKAPTGKGSWPAFWSLGSNFPTTPWPTSGEIDFLEIFNTTNDTTITPEAAMHWDASTNPALKQRQYVSGASSSTLDGTEFHVYEVERTADRIIARVNGNIYANLAIDKEVQSELRDPMYLILNLAMGGNARSGLAPDATTTWPQELLVDYVRVYKAVGDVTKETLVDFGQPSNFVCFNDGSGICGEETGFAGGKATVVDNPHKTGNDSDQVARFKKFVADDASQTWGGTTLKLDENAINFSESNNVFTAKVYSGRAVGVRLQLGDDDNSDGGIPVDVQHTGTGWETLVFNFNGLTNNVTKFNELTLIFDNGTMGAAVEDDANDNWTFYFDDIVLQGQSVAKPVSDFDGGLITNGDFEDGSTDWTGNHGTLEIKSDNTNYFYANVATAGEAYNVNLQQPVTFAANTTYKLSFSAKSDSGRTIIAAIGRNSDPWTNDQKVVQLTNEWKTYTIELNSNGFNTTANRVFFDLGNVVGDVSIDNVSLADIDPSTGGTEPSTAPTAPTVAAADATSIFAGAYTNITGVTFPTWEGQTTTTTTETIAGNEVLKLATFNYQGIDFTDNAQDVSGKTALHLDYWTSDVNELKVFLIDTAGTEAAYTITPTKGSWQSVIIPLSEFSGVDLTAIKQFKFEDGNETSRGNGTLYLDNIYFAVSPVAATLPVDFQLPAGAYAFGDFDGGALSVVTNPTTDGINTSTQAARMTKQAGKVWGGSSFQLANGVDLATNKYFTMMVKANRNVPVLLKFEEPGNGNSNAQVTANYTGTDGAWQELSFDFSSTGLTNAMTKLVLIFEDGTMGAYDASDATAAANWTFYVDDIKSTTVPTPTAPTDTPTTPTIAASEVTSIVGNAYTNITGVTFPTWEGQTTTTTTETIAGNEVLKLATFNYQGIDFTDNAQDVSGKTALHLDYWTSDVNELKVFLIDTSGTEAAYTITPTKGSWQSVIIPLSEFSGVDLTAIKQFKFEDGNETSRGNGTLYLDNIYFAVSPVAATLPVDFQLPAGAYAFGDFDGGALSVVTNPTTDGINTSTQAARMTKQAGKVWGGSSFQLANGVDLATNKYFTMMVKANRNVPVLLKFEEPGNGNSNAQVTANYTGTGGAWQELSFDFSSTGLTNAMTKLVLIFEDGTMGAYDASDATAAANWTFYVDDITSKAKDNNGGGSSSFDGGLITNGNFASAGNSWANEGSGTVTYEATNGKDNGHGVRLQSDTNQNTVLQQVDLGNLAIADGTAMNVSFDVKGTLSNGAVLHVALIPQGVAGVNGIVETINALDATWTNKNYTTTAQGTGFTGSVQFQLNLVCGQVANCSGDVYIDNVSVTEDGGTATPSYLGVFSEEHTDPTVAYTLQASAVLGGNATNASDSSTAVTTDDGTNVIQINWTSTSSTNWGGALLNFTAATDVSAYSDLVFSLNTSSLPSYANMHVKLESSAGTNTGQIVHLSNVVDGAVTGATAVTNGNWTTYTIPLVTFKENVNLNLAQITSIGFWSPSTTAASGEHNIIGTAYIDNIYFKGTSSSGSGGNNGGGSSNFDGGLITNGDFENGTTDWSGNHGTLEIRSDNTNYFYANVATAVNAYEVNLQQPITFAADKTYTLSFSAKSDSGRTIIAAIGKNSPDWNNDQKVVQLTNDWKTYTADLSSAGFNTTANRVFFDLGNVVGDVSIDNVSLKAKDTSGGGSPATAPDTPPTRNAADVVSIFGNTYTNITGVDTNPNWNQATTATTETIASNEVLKLANFNYQGIDFAGNAQDVSGMTNLHFDYWTADSTDFGVYLITKVGNNNSQEDEQTVPSITTGSWQSVDIPLSSYSGIDLNSLIQLKLEGNGTVYIDNIYFYKLPSFSLSSATYADAGAIPSANACNVQGGSNTSPQYTWTNAPSGTVAYAIIMDDETSPCGTGENACKHWSVFNIPAATTALAAGVDVSTITGTVEGNNYTNFGTGTGYAGPCPPSEHTYKTTIYALDAAISDTSTLVPNATRSYFETNYASSILGSATITGTYTPTVL